jgi:hypothetical protein
VIGIKSIPWEITTEACWNKRNNELNKDQNLEIAQSAQNEGIQVLYKDKGEICHQDSHIFNTDLEILLKSRL